VNIRLVTKGVPTGQRHYFERLEPCFRDGHAFRSDLQLGSFNDWSRLGLNARTQNGGYVTLTLSHGSVMTQPSHLVHHGRITGDFRLKSGPPSLETAMNLRNVFRESR
jgi:hypothetical protein